MTDPVPEAPAVAPPAAPPAPAASGLVYADVPNRVIAYIIDVIVLFVLNVIVLAILGAIGLATVTMDGLEPTVNVVASIIAAILGLVVSGAYFIYTWTSMRGTVGMKALGMQIGNAGDGATMTVEQGVRRFLALGAIFTIAQVLNPLPLLGWIISLAALAWVVFLLYTTATSPTKQGWHDHFANTMVVKTAKSVG